MIDDKQQSQSEEEVFTGKCGVPTRTHRSSWGYLSVGRDQEDELPNPKAEKLLRRRSSSFMAVQSALFQLNYISDFDVVKIGEGFFAEVFKATHIATGEIMVLKMNKQAQNSKKMLDEIQLLNRLAHPNILKYRGCCVHEGQLHALTEYINGGSLEDILQDRTVPLPWTMRASIASDISKGMAYLHSKKIFHRDLTSKNCLVQIDEGAYIRTVVADFGLAAKFRKPSGEYHNEVVGTPYWMAPECLCGKPYCEQADIFSFGIILAELATRVSADPDFLPRTKVYGVNFHDLRKMALDCPVAFFELTKTCCQLDPNLRPNFNELQHLLEGIQSEIRENNASTLQDGSIQPYKPRNKNNSGSQSCPILVFAKESLFMSHSFG